MHAFPRHRVSRIRAWIALVLLACAVPAAASLVTFDPLPVGAVFGVSAGHAPGDYAFTEDGVDVHVQELIVGGAPYFHDAIVENAPPVFGVFHVMHTDNICTTYDFPAPGNASFVFLDMGGEVNIEVNGAGVHVGPDFPSIAGPLAPGVVMNVMWAPVGGGAIRGRVDLIGPVQRLRIGGQELLIDGVGCDNGMGIAPGTWSGGVPCDVGVTYDYVTPGTVYGAPAGQAPGDVAFTEDGIPVELAVFDAGSGPLFDRLTVDTASWPLGPGNQANVDNISQRFRISALGRTVREVRFQYIALGGVENLQVNGAPLYIGDLDAAPAGIAPGVTFSVTTYTYPGGLYGEVTLTGDVQDLLVGGQEFAMDNLCVVLAPDTTAAPCDHVSDMESLPFGAVFGPGSGLAPGDLAFSEDGIDTYLDTFDTGSGLMFNDAYVDAAYYGVGDGQVLVTGNVTAVFDFGALGTVSRVTLDYMDWDGIENLQVNGETLWVDEFEALPANVATGVTLTVSEWSVPGGRGGRLELTGDVQKLRIGGQQFYLDNVCVELAGTTGAPAARKAPAPVLAPAFPNPFNPSTTLAFTLPRSAAVRLTVHDLAGRLVRTLVDGELPAGSHRVVWRGDDADGRPVGAGLYFVRVATPDGVATQRIALVK